MPTNSTAPLLEARIRNSHIIRTMPRISKGGETCPYWNAQWKGKSQRWQLRHPGFLLRATGYRLTRLQKCVHVAFVHQRRSGIHKSWDGRKAVFRPIHIQSFEFVVIEVVQHFQADEGHTV